jgi:PLP dependent protein
MLKFFCNNKNMTAVQNILQQIRQAERNYQRPPGSVRLLVVTKGRSIPAVRAVAAQGQHAFGENYLQEALEKIEALSDLTLEWHFIGVLQANKTRAVAQHFAWVHSVNRVKIAERLSQHRPPNLLPLNVCLEVNISGETSKSGASIDELGELARQVHSLPRLRLRGLMAIPAPNVDFEQQLSVYRRVSELQQRLIAQGFPLDTLSMGMSGDFVAAIAAGATIVRIGTAVFEG